MAKRKGRSYLAGLVGVAVLLYIILAEGGALIAGAVLRGAEATWAPSLAQLILVPFSLGPPLLFLWRRGRAGGLRLRLGRGRVPFWMLLSLFLGAMVAVNSCANLLRGLLTRGMDLPEAAARLPEDGLAQLFYFLTACVVAPVLEELFFRGAVQGALRPYGTALSLTMTALLFTLAHTNLWELPVVFVLGFIIGYVAEVSGSLLPGILLHAVNNLVMFLIMLQQRQIGGIATLAFAFWLILLFVALFAGAVWMISKQRLWPKFRLRRHPATGPGAAGTKAARARGDRRTALGRLLSQPMFLVGLLAMAAYCLIRLLAG